MLLTAAHSLIVLLWPQVGQSTPLRTRPKSAVNAKLRPLSAASRPQSATTTLKTSSLRAVASSGGPPSVVTSQQTLAASSTVTIDIPTMATIDSRETTVRSTSERVETPRADPAPDDQPDVAAKDDHHSTGEAQRPASSTQSCSTVHSTASTCMRDHEAPVLYRLVIEQEASVAVVASTSDETLAAVTSLNGATESTSYPLSQQLTGVAGTSLNSEPHNVR